MPFFDFHVHPGLKPLMSEPANFPSPWELIKLKFKNPNLLTALLKCSNINEVVDSQASLSQLARGKVNLVAIALHPPESNMMRDGLITKIAEQEQTQFINLNRVRDIGSGDIYFRMLNEEISNLRENTSLDGKKLKILKKISEYKPNDLDTIHAVLTIEGPHAFYGPRQNKTEAEVMAQFWDNFNLFTSTTRIFSMNIAHLQDNDFCNHAFGIQIFKAPPFYPAGYGISQHGFKLLQQMKEKGILIDIKHTSLFARKQLYDYRIGETNWPLVCTHAGLTGISQADRGKYFFEMDNDRGFKVVRHFKPAGYLLGTSFNACSINLYDEDVKEIIYSGGIIGLSLDQRILGTPVDYMLSDNYFYDMWEEEVISPDEKDYFINVPRLTPSLSDILETTDIILEDKQDNIRFHGRHFLNQVFHLFKIADKYNINKAYMAQRICIGSDFDGLINPVDGCPNVTMFEKFKNYLTRYFMEWEEDFSEVTGIRVSDFITPKELMENIFYRNGLEFLKERYT